MSTPEKSTSAWPDTPAGTFAATLNSAMYSLTGANMVHGVFPMESVTTTVFDDASISDALT